jgi:hypothetical protein
MTVTAIVGLVIIDVVMTVQTIQIILIYVRLVSEQDFAGIILKHQANRFGRCGRGKSSKADDPCDQ